MMTCACQNDKGGAPGAGPATRSRGPQERALDPRWSGRNRRLGVTAVSAACPTVLVPHCRSSRTRGRCGTVPRSRTRNRCPAPDPHRLTKGHAPPAAPVPGSHRAVRFCLEPPAPAATFRAGHTDRPRDVAVTSHPFRAPRPPAAAAPAEFIRGASSTAGRSTTYEGPREVFPGAFVRGITGAPEATVHPTARPLWLRGRAGLTCWSRRIRW